MNNATILFKRCIIMLFVTVTACSYSPPLNITERETFNKTLSSNDYSIVFGSVQWIENGVEKKISKYSTENHVKMVLRRLEDKLIYGASVYEDGRYVWPLKPGMYVIEKIIFSSISGSYNAAPQVAFLVPDKGKVFYLGALRSIFTFYSGPEGMADLWIEDHADSDYANITESFDITPGNITKSLMIHDKRIPYSIDSTAELNLTLQILHVILSIPK